MNQYQTVSYLYIHIRNIIKTKLKQSNHLHNKLSKKKLINIYQYQQMSYFNTCCIPIDNV